MKKHTTPTRSRRRRPSLLAVTPVLVALTAACAGPRAPLEIGAKSVPLDVVLGAKQAVAAAPVPPLIFSAGGTPRGSALFFPEPDETPTRERVRTPAAPKPCVDDPSAVPRSEAPSRVVFPPKARPYLYAVKGSSKTGGVPDGELASTATVEVRKPVWDAIGGQATWDVAVALGDDTTTTSYRSRNASAAEAFVSAQLNRTPLGGLIIVEPVAPAPPDGEPVWGTVPNPFQSIRQLNERVTMPAYPLKSVDELIAATAQPPRGLHNGLYMEKIVSSSGTHFEPPAPGMLLAAFPFRAGSTFDVAGTDGRTTMMYRTTVRPRATVRACGVGIDTWTIELTRGRVIDEQTGESVEFTARYQVAPQFGGLIVSDFTHVQGDARRGTALTRVERTVETTTTTAPGL